MYHSVKLFLLTYCFFFAVSWVDAQQVVSIEVDDKLYKLNYDKVFILDDMPSYPSNISEVLQVADKFRPLETSCYPSVKNGVVWLRFTVQNLNAVPAYLIFSPSIPDSISLYAMKANGDYHFSQTGALLPFRERGILSPNPNLLLVGEQGQPQTYYLKVCVSFSEGGKLEVGNYKAVDHQFHLEDIWNGIFSGILILICLLNLFMYPIQKRIAYFWYALFSFNYLILFNIQNGFLHEWLFYDTPQYNHSTHIYLSLSVIFGTLFAVDFLNTKSLNNFIYRGLQASAIVAAGALLLGVIGYAPLSNTISLLVSVPSGFFALAAAVYNVRQKRVAGWFYVFSWLSSQSTVIIFLLDSTGLFFDIPNIKYLIYLGAVGEALFVTAAIFQHIHFMNQEKERANALTLKTIQEKQQIISEQNAVLEHNVHERTKALQEALAREQTVEKQVSEYAKKLEISNKELTEFAYLVSHDLKAPLRNIASFTELLNRKNKEKYDNRDREFMQFIVKGAKQSMQLVEDLLNFSKIDKDLGDPQEINLSEVVSNVCFNLSNLIQEKKAQIDCEPLPIVTAHKALLSQLFQNLIANGIKYNESNPPVVHLGSYREFGKTIFFIRDNGIGIAPKYKEEVFKMFRRLHSVEQYEGSGIGLAFCKKIVETYGGDIWLDSEEGKGTTFYFTLPKTI